MYEGIIFGINLIYENNEKSSYKYLSHLTIITLDQLVILELHTFLYLDNYGTN